MLILSLSLLKVLALYELHSKPVCIASTFYLGTLLLDGDDVMLTHCTFYNEYMYYRRLIDCRMGDLGDNNDLMLMIIFIENVQNQLLHVAYWL